MIRKMELEQLSPMEIEQRSFAIIEEELTAQGICLCPEQAPMIKRCIHTTADFEYAFNLVVLVGAVGVDIPGPVCFAGHRYHYGTFRHQQAGTSPIWHPDL